MAGYKRQGLKAMKTRVGSLIRRRDSAKMHSFSPSAAAGRKLSDIEENKEPALKPAIKKQATIFNKSKDKKQVRITQPLSDDDEVSVSDYG